jgi:hypothetical protein
VLDPDLAAHLATRYRTAERSCARLTVHTVHAGPATAPCDGR